MKSLMRAINNFLNDLLIEIEQTIEPFVKIWVTPVR
jgi:hypothetical protein